MDQLSGLEEGVLLLLLLHLESIKLEISNFGTYLMGAAGAGGPAVGLGWPRGPAL